PYLLVQFTKIGGIFDLTQARARCAFHIRKSEIGDLVAVQAGFSELETPDHQLTTVSIEPWPAVKLKKICDYSALSFHPGSFLISDTRIRSTLCVRSLSWLRSKDLVE